MGSPAVNWIKRFLYEEKTPPIVAAVGVQADRETIARVRARQDEARAKLGLRWIGHLRHTGYVTREQLLRDWNEALIENAAQQSDSVVFLKRRK